MIWTDLCSPNLALKTLDCMYHTLYVTLDAPNIASGCLRCCFGGSERYNGEDFQQSQRPVHGHVVVILVVC